MEKISKKKKIKNCFCTNTQTFFKQCCCCGVQANLFSISWPCSHFLSFLLSKATSCGYVSLLSSSLSGRFHLSSRPPSRWEPCGCAPRRTWRGWVASIAGVPSRIATSTPTWCNMFFPHQDPNTFHVLLPFCFGMSFLGHSNLCE